jgi:MFS transporter, ACS family, hexuronate transporter
MTNMPLPLLVTKNENPWRMLFWLLIAQVMVAFVGRSLGPLGVLIGEDLSLTKAQIGMLPAALFFGQAAVSIPAGFMTDRFGSKKLLLLLSLCLGISFISMTLVSEFWLLLLCVTVGGLGYGGMHPTSNRGIIYWFSLQKRGTAMGIKQMGVTLGSALAGVILLPIASSFGWRPTVFIASVLLLLVGLTSYYFYKDPFQKNNVSTRKENRNWRRSLWNMFQNRPLFLVSLSALGLIGAQMCLNTYVVIYSYEKIGLSLFLSGLLLVISEVSGSLGRMAWGIISDLIFKGERLIILIFISILTLICSLTMSFLPSGTPFFIMVFIVALFGFTVSGFNGIWMNLASELVPQEQSGLSSGFSITLGSIGAVIVPPIFGFMVDYYSTFSAGWYLLVSLMVLVLIVLVILRRLITLEKLTSEKGDLDL